MRLRLLAATLLICGCTAASASAAIPAPPGGPILVATATGAATDSYYPEILRAEGLNEFDIKSAAGLSAATLAAYDTVILAPGTSPDVAALTSWVQGGGNLIAMRPGASLASLLGLASTGTTLSNGYLKVDSSSSPGEGIVSDTIQYHGAADRYTTTGGARAVATLYSSATTATSNPAVTVRDVGSGHASAFTYDLAQSVYLTRQGNPAWVGEDHDDDGLTRATDMFQAPSGGTDWLNKSKIQIPQADEQQRLLANMIIELGAGPLPRFWYFPRGDKAEVVMTGDDHGSGATSVVFDGLMANDPSGGCTAQQLANWECVRSTSYVYPDSPVDSPDLTAADYQALGFEVALHLTVDDSSCSDFGPPPLNSLDAELSAQLRQFSSAFRGVSAPATIRTHCIPWSDWDSQPKTDLAHGIRLNTDYYWFAANNWDQDLAGMFTGSGMPMRFAAANGSLIDVYQATTYSADDATDSPNTVVPTQMRTLIDNALGAKGYYGAFTVIVHNDGPESDSPARDAVVAYARSHDVSVISERQLLTWLDGRDNSSFGNVDFGSGALTFTISAGAGTNGLQAMVPADGTWGQLQTLTRGGSPVSFTTETIKGVDYALFSGAAGSYRATYSGTHSPQTTITTAPNDSTSTSAQFAFTSSASGSTFECKLDDGAFGTCSSPKNYSGLAPGTHTFQVRATDASGVTDPTPASASWTISAVPPPDTTITQSPGDGPSTSASVGFASSPSGATFECSLDGGTFSACTSPKTYTGLAVGTHTFQVRATANGSTDPTPAQATWKVTPETTISQAPPDGTATSASIPFTSSASGATFECKLDGGAFAACTSPKSYQGLALGPHTFQVRAAANGATDPTPATASWTVTAVPPPQTTIAQAPTDGTSASASIPFTSSVGGATFECSLDGGVFSACTSPKAYTGLSLGEHTFQVRATANGATDPSPAQATWKVTPETSISQSPDDGTSTSASFPFTSSASGATFECSLDGGVFSACTSPKSYTGLGLGQHTFQVRATANGATDPTPATASWTISAPPPAGGGGSGGSSSGSAGATGSTGSTGATGSTATAGGTSTGTAAGSATSGTAHARAARRFLTTSGKTFRPGGKRRYVFKVRTSRMARLVIRIRDARGEVVREIRIRRHAPGVVTIRWSGTDKQGRRLAPGRYRYAVTALGNGYHRTSKGALTVLSAR